MRPLKRLISSIPINYPGATRLVSGVIKRLKRGCKKGKIVMPKGRTGSRPTYLEKQLIRHDAQVAAIKSHRNVNLLKEIRKRMQRGEIGPGDATQERMRLIRTAISEQQGLLAIQKRIISELTNRIVAAMGKDAMKAEALYKNRRNTFEKLKEDTIKTIAEYREIERLLEGLSNMN